MRLTALAGAVPSPSSAALLVSAGVALTLALLAWRRPVRGHTAFALLLLAVAEWSALAALELAAPALATKVVCAKLEYVGISAIPPLWLLFSRAYEGAWPPLPRRASALLWVLPLLTVGLALTNEHHGLLWARITAPAPGAPLVYQHGPWFWIVVAYGYLLLGGGSLLLLRSIGRTAPVYRGQRGILLAGLTAPWLGNLAYLLGLSPVRGLDPTPFAFTLSGVLVFVGLIRFRLLDLMPIARATLVEHLVDGVVVIDARGRLVDLNPAARRLLGVAAGPWIGRDARAVFERAPALLGVWEARGHAARARPAPAPVPAPGTASASEGASEGAWECEFPAPANAQLTLDARIVPLPAPDGHATGIVVVLHDITERKRAADRAQQLAREQLARQQAEEALRVRAEVLATVAHDLKSPLTTVTGLAQLLQRQIMDAAPTAGPELAARLGRIERAATKMNWLIEELLDVARLEAGQPLRLEPAPTDLVALTEQVVTEQRAHSPAHDVQVEAAPPALIGQWDAFRLERVLDNLLGNALKYSPPGSTVRVRVRAERDAAVLEVVDQGVGIPAAALPHLFERFHRAGNVGTTPGTGLGLAGVRRIVEAHGGVIALRSQEGQGTTVTVRLPR